MVQVALQLIGRFNVFYHPLGQYLTTYLTRFEVFDVQLQIWIFLTMSFFLTNEAPDLKMSFEANGT